MKDSTQAPEDKPNQFYEESGSPHFHRVRHFLHKAGQAAPERLTMPDEAQLLLRSRLILEEAFETITALGVEVLAREPWNDESRSVFLTDPTERPTPQHPKGYQAALTFSITADVDVAEALDGAADTRVVTTGLFVDFGVPDEPFQAAVDEANLAKGGPGSFRDAHGKWNKPPTWQAPDHLALLAACDPLPRIEEKTWEEERKNGL